MHGYVLIDPEAIRSAMSRQGLTATDVAREGGVSPRHVQNMARGDRTRVSIGVASIVAERLNMPVDMITVRQLDEIAS